MKGMVKHDEHPSPVSSHKILEANGIGNIKDGLFPAQLWNYSGFAYRSTFSCWSFRIGADISVGGEADLLRRTPPGANFIGPCFASFDFMPIARVALLIEPIVVE